MDSDNKTDVCVFERRFRAIKCHLKPILTTQQRSLIFKYVPITVCEQLNEEITCKKEYNCTLTFYASPMMHQRNSGVADVTLGARSTRAA